MSDKSLADMRKDYTRGGLDESQAPAEPVSLFSLWLADALATEQPPLEANAFVLATVDEQARPHSRVLLLKGHEGRGFTFFTNYQGAKASQLAANPCAAMTFWWPTLERQVRIEGPVARVSAAESDQYFHSRPLGSRIGAWTSPQSQVLADRSELDGLLASTRERFADAPPQRPEHWGGYRLMAERIEFWQGRASRLHDRLNYLWQPDGSWLRQRLAP